MRKRTTYFKWCVNLIKYAKRYRYHVFFFRPDHTRRRRRPRFWTTGFHLLQSPNRMNVVLTLRDKVTIDFALSFPEGTQQAVLKNRWQLSDPTQEVTPTITSFSCWSLIRTHYTANKTHSVFNVDKPISRRYERRWNKSLLSLHTSHAEG